jgi:hypothetical protein
MTAFRHLTRTDILRICRLIEDWPLPTLSWDALCREVEIHIGHRYTRQSLEKKPEIKAKYLARQAHRTKVVPVDEAEMTIQRLKHRVAELEKTLADYDQRFLRHVEAAVRWNKSPQDLEEPLIVEPPLPRKS